MYGNYLTKIPEGLHDKMHYTLEPSEMQMCGLLPVNSFLQSPTVFIHYGPSILCFVRYELKGTILLLVPQDVMHRNEF